MKKQHKSYALLSFGLSIICLVLFSHCKNEDKKTSLPVITELAEKIIPKVKANTTPFDRTEIRNRLEAKISAQQPLIVHVYIPLCDNIHQGIVPTTKSLGDGFSTRTNLYWATSGGTKKFFQKHADWKQVYIAKNINGDILERVAFERTYKNTKVYLIADAYQGDKMEETVNDFLAAASSQKQEKLGISPSLTLDIAGASDLVMFNGHNGMMDNIDVKNWVNDGSKHTDVVINACVTYDYFEEELLKAKAYPLVRTRSLLYPGACVLAQVIDDWVADIPEAQLTANAGRTYCEKHDCGRGSKVFKSGWRN